MGSSVLNVKIYPISNTIFDISLTLGEQDGDITAPLFLYNTVIDVNWITLKRDLRSLKEKLELA